MQEGLSQAAGGPQDDRGGLKQRGRERREQLQTMISSRPSKPPRNDIRPDMQLIDIKITDLRAPAHETRLKYAATRYKKNLPRNLR